MSNSEKNKENNLRNFVKKNLSMNTQGVISSNEEELNLIIEQLRKTEINEDRGVELSQLKNVNKNHSHSRLK